MPFITALCLRAAPPLIEGLLAFHLTGNPLPVLTLPFHALFQKDR